MKRARFVVRRSKCPTGLIIYKPSTDGIAFTRDRGLDEEIDILSRELDSGEIDYDEWVEDMNSLLSEHFESPRFFKL